MEVGPLSLPEAFVLLDGPRADPHEVVFLAILELVARGGARVVHLSQSDPDECAVAPQSRDRVAARPIAVLFDLLLEAMKLSPRVNEDYATPKYLSRAFGSHWIAVDTYVRREVWASLEARGLLSTKDAGFDALAVYPWHLTEAGKSERDRMRAQLAASGEWRRQPGTALLVALGLPVPNEQIFDAIDVLEDTVTPGALPSPISS